MTTEITNSNFLEFVKAWQQDPKQFTSKPIAAWNVSQVTNFTAAFFQDVEFNEDISEWDTSSATTFQQMFDGCASFNQDISDWDTSHVEDFGYMFYEADSFNQNLTEWNVSKAKTFRGMFMGATQFEGTGLKTWGSATSEVTDTNSMFREAAFFNEDIDSWKMSQVTDMYAMFYKASSFNQALNSWSVESVGTFEHAFEQSGLDQKLCWPVVPGANTVNMFESAPCGLNDGVCLDTSCFATASSARTFSEGAGIDMSVASNNYVDSPAESGQRAQPLLIAGMIGMVAVLAAGFGFVLWKKKQPRTDPGPEEWRDADDQSAFSFRWPAKSIPKEASAVDADFDEDLDVI
jgi:surface protein